VGFKGGGVGIMGGNGPNINGLQRL